MTHRRQRPRSARTCRTVAIAVTTAAGALGIAPHAHAQRALGIDVSDWQGSLSRANWQTIHKSTARGGGGKDFTFIRSSRGGTTGTYDEVASTGTLSQQYDDLYFYQNIDRATSVGMFAGPYHFARPDIVTTTAGSNGIANTGTDDANH